VFFPPEPGLAQHRVGRLPLPLDAAEFVALGDEHRPDLLEDTPLDPPLEPVMDRALGAEALGQLVPLAPAPQAEDDRIEHFPPVGDPASGRFLGPELLEDRLDAPPQFVGDLPDRTQGFAFVSRLPAGHRNGSCSNVR
jgi:hypothetical protein